MARENFSNSPQNLAFWSEILSEAANDFTKGALGLDAKQIAIVRQKRAWAAEIDVLSSDVLDGGNSDAKNLRVRVFADKKHLKKIALILLGEGFDDGALRDLLGEIVNLIAGRAKVIAGERGVRAAISTPRFVSAAAAVKKEEFLLCFSFADGCELAISALQELK
ncbi:hypothetical protein FACS189487_09070 [Campylobacterota bacterium]|nr:hypothetical protein FACS189487_09070 [Campylobacterota bacterium]